MFFPQRLSCFVRCRVCSVLNVGAREEPTPEDVRLAYDTTDVLLADEPTARLAPALKIALPAINQVRRFPLRTYPRCLLFL